MNVLKRKIVLRISVLPIIILCFYFPLSNYYQLIDNNKLLAQIYSLGIPVLFILLPYLLILFTDTCGWLYCFTNNIKQISIIRLYIIRFATETLQLSLPGGAIYADLVRPYLLKKHLHIAYPDSISAGIITKANILIAQILFLVFGFTMMILFYTDNGNATSLLSGSAIYIGLLILIVVTFLFTYLLYRKNLLFRIKYLLNKIKLKKSERIIHKIIQHLVEINDTISLYARNHKAKLFLTVIFFFLTWILMALESLVILKILGIDANVLQMILIESSASIVRMLFFFIPGAIGPQDAALILLFNLVGLPDPAINSILFVILKRSKELVWISVGYLLLMLLGIKPGNLIGRKRISYATNQ